MVVQVLCTAPAAAAAAGPHGCDHGLHARVGLCTALINSFQQAVGVRQGFQPCQQHTAGSQETCSYKAQPWARMAGSCASAGLGHQAGAAPRAPAAPFSPDQGAATLPSDEGRRCRGSQAA